MVNPEDQNKQYILWRDKSNKPLNTSDDHCDLRSRNVNYTQISTNIIFVLRIFGTKVP